MRIFYFLIIFFILGCESNSHNKNTKKIENNQTKITKTKKNNPKIIKIGDINLVFKNNKLIYPDKKIVILFENKNFYSKEEERILKKLKVKFYKTDNEFLQKYFNITIYPTIIVLDKNQTIRYENFTPYYILKTEGF